jgi:hypothetical protein
MSKKPERGHNRGNRNTSKDKYLKMDGRYCKDRLTRGALMIKSLKSGGRVWRQAGQSVGGANPPRPPPRSSPIINRERMITSKL